jgi:hypothetical protein
MLKTACDEMITSSRGASWRRKFSRNIISILELSLAMIGEAQVAALARLAIRRPVSSWTISICTLFAPYTLDEQLYRKHQPRGCISDLFVYIVAGPDAIAGSGAG